MTFLKLFLNADTHFSKSIFSILAVSLLFCNEKPVLAVEESSACEIKAVVKDERPESVKATEGETPWSYRIFMNGRDVRAPYLEKYALKSGLKEFSAANGYESTDAFVFGYLPSVDPRPTFAPVLYFNKASAAKLLTFLIQEGVCKKTVSQHQSAQDAIFDSKPMIADGVKKDVEKKGSEPTNFSQTRSNIFSDSDSTSASLI